MPRRGDAEGAKGAHATHPEHQLLVQPHLPTADVQDVGDGPVGLVVVGNVGIEQEDRHATDLDAPDGDGEVTTGQLDRDMQWLAILALHSAEWQP